MVDYCFGFRSTKTVKRGCRIKGFRFTTKAERLPFDIVS